MEEGLQQNPLWPSALGAVETHFRRWREDKAAPRGGSIPPTRLPDRRGWSALSGDLTALGLDNATRDAVLSWADAVASQALKEPLKLRLLHPMEREMLTTEAYGYLLDLYRLGLLGIQGLEQVLELCATLPRLPASREQAAHLAQRVLSDNIEADGYGRAH